MSNRLFFIILTIRIKIGLVFGFCGCNFIGIGLVSVCHFPENGISNPDLCLKPAGAVGGGAGGGTTEQIAPDFVCLFVGG